jgi:putative hydrolase of the HAD superfamily
MADIRAVFWDIGGVLASNAWDREQRRAVLEQFGMPIAEFEERHELVFGAFETGHLTLDEYLDRTVFCRPQKFSREKFKEAMFAQSQPNPDALAIAREVSATKKYLCATINNESRELNQYRIEQFGLRRIFTVFVSSCYVSMRKPEERIFRLALDLLQVPAQEACMIDDRAVNLESAKRLGMHTIEFKGAESLRDQLRELGVQVNLALSAVNGD